MKLRACEQPNSGPGANWEPATPVNTLYTFLVSQSVGGMGMGIGRGSPFIFHLLLFFDLPKSGTASLVAGIVSATTCENTVRERSIVTPAIANEG